MTDTPNPAGTRLNALLAEAAQPPLDPTQSQHFEALLSLFIRWNARINLSSIRDEESILSRHFVESIACARALPAGISTLLDYGSGAGFPGLPIALCRPEIAVTLAESQNKKAAFLREAVRQLGLEINRAPEELSVFTGHDLTVRRKMQTVEQEASGHDFSRAADASKLGWALAPEECSMELPHENSLIASGCAVHSGRAELLTTQFDCVTLRAVDKMDRAVQAAAQLVRPGGWLALMTTTAALPALKESAGANYSWTAAPLLPNSPDRLLALGKRAISSPS